MKDNIDILKNKIVDKFSAYNYTFIKKGKNYFYDDLLNDNNIIEVSDFKPLLNQNIPYILIYSRKS